jgi:type II restriction enzyme
MNLQMDASVAAAYSNKSQQSRVITETWVEANVFCVSCGNDRLKKFENNRPVADFFCESCHREYELKSKRGTIGETVIDGEYHKKIERLNSSTNPSLLMLGYDDTSYRALELSIVPFFFFTENLIQKRNPLSATARRAGWTGSNILLSELPEAGRIYFFRNGEVRTKKKILSDWERTNFLAGRQSLEQRGWVIDVLKCVEKIGEKEFSLADVYQFETELASKHIGNRHVKDKIRQQLQVLRDQGFLEFIGRGQYRLK